MAGASGIGLAYVFAKELNRSLKTTASTTNITTKAIKQSNKTVKKRIPLEQRWGKMERTLVTKQARTLPSNVVGSDKSGREITKNKTGQAYDRATGQRVNYTEPVTYQSTQFKPSKIGNVFDSIYNTSKSTGAYIGKTYTKSFKSMGKQVKSMSDGFKGMGQYAVAGFLFNLISALNPLEGTFTALSDIFTLFGDILGTAFTPVISTLYEVMLPLLDSVFIPMAKTIGDVLSHLAEIGALQTIIKVIMILLVAMGIAIMISLVPSIWAFLAPLLPLIAAIAVIILIIMNWGRIMTWFGAIGDHVMARITNAFASFYNWISGIVSTLTAGGVNMGTKAYVDVPAIPAFGNGGMVFGPTLAIVGEKGPERISPLSDSTADDDEANYYRERQATAMEELVVIGRSNKRGSWF